MLSSDIGSVWSGRLGLRTYEAKSDVNYRGGVQLAIAGSEHISEFRVGISAKFGVYRVFGRLFGLPCAEFQFNL